MSMPRPTLSECSYASAVPLADKEPPAENPHDMEPQKKMACTPKQDMRQTAHGSSKRAQANADADALCRSLAPHIGELPLAHERIHQALLTDAIHFDLPHARCTEGVALAHARGVIAKLAKQCVFKIGITHCLKQRWRRYLSDCSGDYAFNRMVCVFVSDHAAVAGMAEAALIREYQEHGVAASSWCANKLSGGDTKVGEPPHFLYCVYSQ